MTSCKKFVPIFHKKKYIIPNKQITQKKHLNCFTAPKLLLKTHTHTHFFQFPNWVYKYTLDLIHWIKCTYTLTVIITFSIWSHPVQYTKRNYTKKKESHPTYVCSLRCIYMDERTFVVPFINIYLHCVCQNACGQRQRFYIQFTILPSNLLPVLLLRHYIRFMVPSNCI